MKSIRLKVGILLLGSILALSSFAPLFLLRSEKAEAQGGYSAEWIDRTHIRVTEGPPLNRTSIYTDSNLDGNYNFKNLNQSGNCQSEIWIDGTPPSEQGDIIVVVTDAVDRNCQLRYDSRGSHDPGDVVLCEGPDGRPLWDRRGYTGGAGNCNDSIRAASLRISGASAGSINFRFVNDNTIEKVDGSQTLIREADNTFVEEGGECGDIIILDGGSRTMSGQTVRTGTYQQRSSGGDGGGCRDDNSQNAYVTEAAAPGGGGGGGGGGAGAPPEDSCESAGALGWIMCPVVTAIEGALNWVDTQIQALLEIDANYYNNADMRLAFNAIRNIAYIILVPIVLVMVISTALGFDFVSAYTVKRALPRLFVAVVFIALSYQIGVFLIEMFNALGAATLGIITAPFANGTQNLSLRALFDDGSITTGLLQHVIAVPGLIIALWLFGGTLLLFAISAFLVLLLRQIFIVVLLLAAPLAILAWIFPGNDKLWKLWWGSFSKLLIMYPLIMAIIAVGRIFAFTIDHSNPAGLEGAVLKPVMTIVAYTIPYAFIPFTFKFAGGLFASVSGMVNDRSKGLFDRQRQKRADKLQRTAQGNLFKQAPDKGLRLRSRLNTLGAGAMNINKSGVGLTPGTWRPKSIRANMQTAMANNSMAEGLEAMEKNADYQSWRFDDDLNKAAAGTRNATDLRKRLKAMNYAGGDSASIEQAVARVERVRKQVSTPAFDQMTTLSAVGGGTAYKDAGEMAEALAYAGRGDAATTATLVAKARDMAKGAGRIDQGGAGFGDTFTAVQNLQKAMTKPGGITADDRAAATAKITGGAINSQGGFGLVGPQNKKTAIENSLPILRQRLDEAHAKGGEAYDRELARVAALYDTMSSTSPQNAEVLAEGLLSYRAGTGDLSRGQAGPAPAGASTESVQAAIESRRGSDAFLEMRREYGTAARTAVAANATQAGVQNQGGGAGPPAGMPPSDRRLKRNIEHLGTIESGINIYRFQYLWSDQVYVGVMAQDLIDSHPDALSLDEAGFYRVDYSVLGLEMLTLEEWEARRKSTVNS